MAKAIVRVDEFAISGLVQTEVGEYGNRMGRQIRDLAINLAPRRSGELKASHRYAGFLKRGPYKVGTRVVNTAPHALYVHEGTRGPIFPRPPRLYLVVPRSADSMPFRTAMTVGQNVRGKIVRGKSPNGYYRHVRGQAANPWLAEAGHTVAFRAANFSFA